MNAREQAIVRAEHRVIKAAEACVHRRAGDGISCSEPKFMAIFKERNRAWNALKEAVEELHRLRQQKEID